MPKHVIAAGGYSPYFDILERQLAKLIAAYDAFLGSPETLQAGEHYAWTAIKKERVRAFLEQIPDLRKQMPAEPKNEPWIKPHPVGPSVIVRADFDDAELLVPAHGASRGESARDHLGEERL